MEPEQNIKKHASIGAYQLLQTLGQGALAKVKLGYKSQDNKYYAIKIYKKTHDFEKNRESLTKEFKAMQGLSHKNLINLIEIMPDVDYVKKNGQHYKTMAIVIDYAASGELFEFVAQSGAFSEKEARTYYNQFLDGLEYLHGKGLAHRDLKPENILFDDEFTLKLADFGFATALAGKDESGLLFTVLGTESYMAPEIHAKSPYSGTSVDLFASAIILFILLCQHPPFMKADAKDPYYKLIVNNKHNVFWQAHSRNKAAGFFSDDLKSFFNAMFAYDPTQRPTLAEVRAHPWVKGATEDMQTIRSKFVQRRVLVQNELERQRVEKQLQKQQAGQSQGSLMFTGAQHFRSGEEADELLAVKEAYHLEMRRQFKEGAWRARADTFVTCVDAQFLSAVILSNKAAFCDEIEIDESKYRFEITHNDNDFNVKTKVQLDFQLTANNPQDAEEFAAQFKLLEGSNVNFRKIQAAVTNIMLKGQLKQGEL